MNEVTRTGTLTHVYTFVCCHRFSCTHTYKQTNIHTYIHALAMSSATAILIDPQIRNWVLFPIFIITLLVGLARHYVQQLIKSTNTSKIKKIKPLQILQRSNRFRQNSRFLPPFAFSSRKSFLQTKKVGLLCQKQERAGTDLK